MKNKDQIELEKIIIPRVCCCSKDKKCELCPIHSLKLDQIEKKKIKVCIHGQLLKKDEWCGQCVMGGWEKEQERYQITKIYEK